MRKLFQLMLLFVIGGNASSQQLVNKSYWEQSRAVDTLFESLRDADSSAAMAKFDEFAARNKGDEQLAYLIKLREYRRNLKHNQRGAHWEQDMIEMENHFREEGLNKLRAEALLILADYYWNYKKNYSIGLEDYIYAYDIASKYSIEEFPHKGIAVYELFSCYYFFRDFESAKKYLLEYWRVIPYKYTTTVPAS